MSERTVAEVLEETWPRIPLEVVIARAKTLIQSIDDDSINPALEYVAKTSGFRGTQEMLDALRPILHHRNGNASILG